MKSFNEIEFEFSLSEHVNLAVLARHSHSDLWTKPGKSEVKYEFHVFKAMEAVGRPGLQIGHREKNSRGEKLKTQEKTQTQAKNSIFRHILETLHFLDIFSSCKHKILLTKQAVKAA